MNNTAKTAFCQSPNPANSAVCQSDERAAFEAWTREAYSATDLDLKKDEGRYVWNEERRLWQCWQARAGIAASAEPSINRYQSTDSTDKAEPS